MSVDCLCLWEQTSMDCITRWQEVSVVCITCWQQLSVVYITRWKQINIWFASSVDRCQWSASPIDNRCQWSASPVDNRYQWLVSQQMRKQGEQLNLTGTLDWERGSSGPQKVVTHSSLVFNEDSMDGYLTFDLPMVEGWTKNKAIIHYETRDDAHTFE